MQQLSIDLETLGILVDSQILSIGLAMFDLKTGEIGDTLYLPIFIKDDWHVNATVGTIKFWTKQAIENPEALKGLFEYEENPNAVYIETALEMIQDFCVKNKPEKVWANGTKFDLGMLEYQFHKDNREIPWWHNSDRCVRTLREFAGNIDIVIEDGVAHNALSDAIWQAKYISAACNKLCLV